MGKFRIKTVFILMVSSLLILSGCQKKDEGVTVDLFNIKVETAPQLEELAKLYEKQHEGTKINITTVGGGEDAAAALQAKFSSGDEPSIFMLEGTSSADKWQDKLLELNEFKLNELVFPGFADAVTLDDKVLGMPVNLEGYGLLINKELFKKAGIDYETIDSYEAFVSAVETLDSKKEDLGIEAVFGFSGKEHWVVSQYSAAFMAPEFDNDIINAFNAKELDMKYSDDFKNYTDLINKYNLQPILNIDYSTSVEEKFIGEKVAIIHQGNWIEPTLNSMSEEFAADKLAIVPTFVGDYKPRIVVGPPFYWGINKTKDEKIIEASKDFLEWMYTNEEAKKMVVNEFKYIPAYSSFEEDNDMSPLAKEILKYVSDGNTVPWIHNGYPDGYGQTIMFPEIQKYFDGQVSWDEFETTMKTKWQEERGK
ncbi:ABC transporter substrate-binding protein [Erysipelothrix urinaevulpis]|uniref:ABC transporter substrate-binding protein n=1 Tax=Erysipelothrix urinaevulpis TaxID=2683717 RepID=UPI0019162498|nr:ABC transporter substrate-binding protein [Erysipelothrix urinaevulpis]